MKFKKYEYEGGEIDSLSPVEVFGDDIMLDNLLADGASEEEIFSWLDSQEIDPDVWEFGVECVHCPREWVEDYIRERIAKDD